MPSNDQELLLSEILKSKKYRYIYPPTIRRIIADLSEKFDGKQLKKQVKRKLHQVWGAYFTRPDFDKLQKKIELALSRSNNYEDIWSDILLLQTSTKERLPLYHNFYRDIFGKLDNPQRVIEYGCGLNALSVKWMDQSIKYVGYDVDSQLIDFINWSLITVGLAPRAQVRLGDVFLFEEYQAADVCLLLKVLVLFERQQSDSALKILKKIPTRYLVISFPTKSLTGIAKGMEEHYRNYLLELIADMNWAVQELLLENELVFIVEK